MKYKLTFLVTVFFCNMITAQIEPPKPDTIFLRSGETAICRIVEDKSNFIKFCLESDSQKVVKRIMRTHIKRYVDNTWANQPFSRNESGTVEYSEVIQAEGASKDRLFLNAKLWLVKAFKDSKEVIQFEDKEQGVIIGKGTFKSAYDQMVRFTVKVQTKDNRYKYTIDQFTLTNGGVSFEEYFSVEHKNKYASQLQNGVKAGSLETLYYFIKNLKTAMVLEQEEEKW